MVEGSLCDLTDRALGDFKKFQQIIVTEEFLPWGGHLLSVIAEPRKKREESFNYMFIPTNMSIATAHDSRSASVITSRENCISCLRMNSRI